MSNQPPPLWGFQQRRPSSLTTTNPPGTESTSATNAKQVLFTRTTTAEEDPQGATAMKRKKTAATNQQALSKTVRNPYARPKSEQSVAISGNKSQSSEPPRAAPATVSSQPGPSLSQASSLSQAPKRSISNFFPVANKRNRKLSPPPSLRQEAKRKVPPSHPCQASKPGLSAGDADIICVDKENEDQNKHHGHDVHGEVDNFLESLTEEELQEQEKLWTALQCSQPVAPPAPKTCQTTLSPFQRPPTAQLASNQSSFSQNNQKHAKWHPSSKPPPQQFKSTFVYSLPFSPGPVPHSPETMKTWIYPIHQKYPLRQYQLSITETAVMYNTLVSLPTGLGKTLIAAVVMYNFYRWFPHGGKVVFCAPTRPLVTQQMEACYRVMGIPEAHTAEISGRTQPRHREGLWSHRRVFFCTPQTLQKDIEDGRCGARSIVCIVLDEAHKAKGDYAYTKVITQIEKTGAKFRVLGLSATPGTSIKAIQEVVDALRIQRIRAKVDSDEDVQPYINEKQVEVVLVKQASVVTEIERLFTSLLSPLLDHLRGHNALQTVRGANATVTSYCLLRAKEDYVKRTNDQSLGGYFFAAQLLARYRADLSVSGLGVVQQKISRSMRDHKFGFVANIFKKAEFQTILRTIQEASQQGGEVAQGGKATEDPKHNNPKLLKLDELLMEHFARARALSKSSRAIVFSQWRDTVHAIVNTLWIRRPLIRPRKFVGQGGSANQKSPSSSSLHGMKQQEQQEALQQFRDGVYNVLVCTCIGEEGLDIGEVDLIVNFDYLRSPIRMIQRSGRTGRQREGRAVSLVAEGQEEQKYRASLSATKTLERALKSCDCFSFHIQSAPLLPVVPQKEELRMDVKDTYHLSQVGGHDHASSWSSRRGQKIEDKLSTGPRQCSLRQQPIVKKRRRSHHHDDEHDETKDEESTLPSALLRRDSSQARRQYVRCRFDSFYSYQDEDGNRCGQTSKLLRRLERPRGLFSKRPRHIVTYYSSCLSKKNPPWQLPSRRSLAEDAIPRDGGGVTDKEVLRQACGEVAKVLFPQKQPQFAFALCPSKEEAKADAVQKTEIHLGGGLEPKSDPHINETSYRPFLKETEQAGGTSGTKGVKLEEGPLASSGAMPKRDRESDHQQRRKIQAALPGATESNETHLHTSAPAPAVGSSIVQVPCSEPSCEVDGPIFRLQTQDSASSSSSEEEEEGDGEGDREDDKENTAEKPTAGFFLQTQESSSSEDDDDGDEENGDNESIAASVDAVPPPRAGVSSSDLDQDLHTDPEDESPHVLFKINPQSRRCLLSPSTPEKVHSKSSGATALHTTALMDTPNKADGHSFVFQETPELSVRECTPIQDSHFDIAPSAMPRRYQNTSSVMNTTFSSLSDALEDTPRCMRERNRDVLEDTPVKKLCVTKDKVNFGDVQEELTDTPGKWSESDRVPNEDTPGVTHSDEQAFRDKQIGKVKDNARTKKLKRLRKPHSVSGNEADASRPRIEKVSRGLRLRFLDEEAAIGSDEDMEGDEEEDDMIHEIEEVEHSQSSFINDSSQLGEWTQDALDDEAHVSDAEDACPDGGSFNVHRRVDVALELRDQLVTPRLNRRMGSAEDHAEEWEEEPTPKSASSQKGLGNMHFIRSVIDHHRRGGDADQIEEEFHRVQAEYQAEETLPQETNGQVNHTNGTIERSST